MYHKNLIACKILTRHTWFNVMLSTCSSAAYLHSFTLHTLEEIQKIRVFLHQAHCIPSYSFSDKVIMAAVSVALWEMQYFVNDSFTQQWREQHEEHVIKCQTSVTFTVTNTFFFFNFPLVFFICLIVSLLSPSSSNTRDLKKAGVTVVGPQKKIVSSLKALDSYTKNGPVPV